MIPFGIGSNYLHLNNVRLYGRFDGIQARQRFEAALADLDPAAFGLPPHALLIVQRIAPAARLRLDSSGRSAAFAQSVQAELTRNAQQAHRPWLHGDTVGAAAVLFADESELMACLLRDWLRGRLSGRWWWRTIMRDFSAPEWWRRTVLPRGDVLPAVLSHLATQGEVIAWITRLSEAETKQAMIAVTQAHAIQLLPEWLQPAPFSQGTETALPSAAPVSLRDQQMQTSMPVRSSDKLQDLIAARQYLLAVVPELQANNLTLLQRRLLALSLGLQRASSWTRSPALVVALQAFETEIVVLDKDDTPDPVAAANNEFRQEEQIPDPDHGLPLPASGPQVQHPLDSSSVSKASVDASSSAVTSLTDKQVSVASPIEHNTIPSGVFVDTDSQSGPVAPPLSILSPVSTPHPDNEPATLFSPGINTQFGGIFYLFNMALALELYGDFTQPRTPGIALSPWDWLALIGRAWFRRDFEQDAVWPLLAELAGRTAKQPPGSDFVAPDSWVIPDEWLKPWGEVVEVQVYVTRKRLQIWHEAGFVIIDVERNKGVSPLVQATQLCAQHETLKGARLARIDKQPQKFIPGINSRSSLSRWIRWILLYLNARLIRALGDDMPDVVARLVCCHAAKIHCTATTLDVHLSLADLPISLRFAGLDRDPGWIPAASRTIAFHFE
ncbi:hypothetical protein Nit79A3_1020 [Nitrosomonas sp. Is79A3]|uniref:hypothetical protein n=1 Tax=Nitrosomonas sp. (strain Is79A3) TaxID=261292 RepID=UPI000215C74D